MAKILVVEDTPDTRNLIRVKLTKAGHEVITAEDGQAAMTKAFTQKPQLIVLDVELPKLDGYTVARRLRQNALTRKIAILMITAKGEIQDKVAGYEAGADDYLTKPFDPSELELRVRQLLMRVAPHAMAETATRQGQLISVFSLRGGVGKTSLAVNLAVTLGQLWSKPVTLLDLALQNGQVALFMGLRPRATVDDLADHYKEYSDAEALAEYFTKYREHLRVLPAPRHPADAERVSAEMLKHLLKLVRAETALVIADLMNHLDDPTLAVLDASDLILLIMTPEVASVQTTSQLLDTFQQLEYPRDKIRLIVNHTFARRALTPQQIESALSTPVAMVLPYDPDLFVHAINAGEPFVSLNPNSAASRALQDFAYKISRSELEPEKDPSPLARAVQARVKVR